MKVIHHLCDEPHELLASRGDVYCTLDRSDGLNLLKGPLQFFGRSSFWLAHNLLDVFCHSLEHQVLVGYHQPHSGFYRIVEVHRNCHLCVNLKRFLRLLED